MRLVVVQLREYEGDTSEKVVKITHLPPPMPNPQPVPPLQSSTTTAEEAAAAGFATGGASSASLLVETREGKMKTHPAPPLSDSPSHKAAKSSHKMTPHSLLHLDSPADGPYSGPFQVRFVSGSSFSLSVQGHTAPGPLLLRGGDMMTRT
jgi:hypothetical protein